MRLLCSPTQSEVSLTVSAVSIIAHLAFWGMVPHTLIDVDPTLVFDPDKVEVLRKVVLHEGCQPGDIVNGQICSCTDIPENNLIGEGFQERSSEVSVEGRALNRKHAFVYVISGMLIAMMLQGVTLNA